MSSSAPQPAVPRPAPWQYTLRSMLGLMFVSGVLIAAWKIAPQGVVLAAGILAAVSSARRLATSLRKSQRLHIGQCGLAAAAWGGLYAVSVGPAVALLNWAPLNREALEWLYAPIVWLHDNTRAAGAIEWYLDFWR